MVFLNTKISGDGNMQLYPTMSRALSISSAMALIRLKTIINSGGVAKQIIKLTSLILRQKKMNHVCIPLSALTVVEITKWTPTYVCFGNIGSITNGTSRNITRSVKTSPTQFAQVRTTLHNDL